MDFFPDSALKNTTGWTKVEATFKAKGGEQYMYIGSFINSYDIIWEESPNISLLDTTNCGYCNGAYYYIDDVYLYGDTNYKAVSVVEYPTEPIQLYPNPAQNIVNINTGKLTNVQVQLFDISGRQLLQQKLTYNQGQIDVSGLSNGVYIVRIFNSHGTLIECKKLSLINGQ